MIERSIALLGEKLDLTAEELADIIWLTLVRQQDTIAVSTPSRESTDSVVVNEVSSVEVSSVETVPPPPPPRSSVETVPPPPPSRSLPEKPQPTAEPAIGIAPRRSQTTPLDRLQIKVANPPSIRDPLALVRSLRPLIRQIPSGQIQGLDEQATAQQIAEAGIWQPIVQPLLEPWLELVLVADESASMLIWRQTVLEFRQLLRNYGAFRDVQLWGLYGESASPHASSLKNGENRLCLRPGIGSEAIDQAPRQPKELVDPSGRRMILLISDCVAPHWQGEALTKMLRLWSKYSPVAIVQVLPEWLWVRTACRGFESVQLTALEPGASNSQLVIDWSSVWQIDPDKKAGAIVPILPLEPDSVMTWSQMVMGQGAAPGYWLQAFAPDAAELEPASESASLSAQQRVEQFQVMSSPAAQRLMGLVAASPAIVLPVIRLIQETMLPKSRQMNVAEVLLGGLLEPIDPPLLGTNPDEVEYRFRDEAIRDLLLAQTPVPDTVSVLSKFIERQFDKSLDEFVAELQVWSQSEDGALVEKTRSFATVTASVLKRKGRKYREFVRQIEENNQSTATSTINEERQRGVNFPGAIDLNSFPPLQEFDFETARIVFEDEEIQQTQQIQQTQPLEYFEFEMAEEEIQQTQQTQPLEPFEFEMAAVEVQRTGILPQRQVVIKRERRQVWGYVEPLSKIVQLEMVAIPEGQFQMGSPQNEPERYEDESPQHLVKVPAFFMGKYPVTQAQWHVVAGLPPVQRKLDPDPSRFKAENRPVENVSWRDATEFCDRLSALTGKSYGLPSEAQWEYAARAGTTTPFHFGELITPDLANYDWSSTYGSVKVTKKKDFQGTTPVGTFPANAFGLYDMHGNVWEWCQDIWHSNYEGAPNDGSAWIDAGAGEDANRVLRGGSWFYVPRSCRSSSRFVNGARFGSYFNGFRVACSAPRTL
jgi:formylglycine-generating enzyme required for sulfatase activity